MKGELINMTRVWDKEKSQTGTKPMTSRTHGGCQTSPLLKAFLATFGIPFIYLLMVHDQAKM